MKIKQRKDKKLIKETILKKFQWRTQKVFAKNRGPRDSDHYYVVQRKSVILGIPLRWETNWEFYKNSSGRNRCKHTNLPMAKKYLNYWKIRTFKF